MELEMVRGCVCDSLTVDGVEEIDLTDEKRKEVLKALGDYITNLPTSELNNLMQLLLDYFGEYEDLGHCDCCGSWIDKNTLKL